MSVTALILFFLCGEASNETGRFRGGGIQRGQRLPWHTTLFAKCSVLHLGRWAGRKGLVTGQHKTLSTTQDGKILRAGRREKAKILIRKSCLSVKVRECLDGAKREKSNSGRAVRGVQKLSSSVSRFSLFPSSVSSRFFIFRILRSACFSHFAFSKQQQTITFFKQRQDRF